MNKITCNWTYETEEEFRLKYIPSAEVEREIIDTLISDPEVIKSIKKCVIYEKLNKGESMKYKNYDEWHDDFFPNLGDIWSNLPHDPHELLKELKDFVKSLEEVLKLENNK